MMMDTDAPTVAERYVVAGQSSNLKCETGDDAPIGAVGVMAAAGMAWTRRQVGAALLRLHTKISRSDLEDAHAQIALQAGKWGIDRPDVVAASVLAWWLARVCRTCSGRKFQLIPGTPMTSNKSCKACKGIGFAPLPHGEAGKRMASWLDECSEASTDLLTKRLRNTRK